VSRRDAKSRKGQRQVITGFATRFDGAAAAWGRAILAQPSRIAGVFWTGGFLASVAALLFVSWSRPSMLALAIIAGVCAVGGGARVVAGARLPRWTLHVDIGVGTVATSVATAVGATRHVPFGAIYIWIALFCALYFRPLLAIAHIGVVGAAYAVVLTVGPKVASPLAAWLALFGTLAVGALVVIGLVTALRHDSTEDPLTGLPTGGHSTNASKKNLTALGEPARRYRPWSSTSTSSKQPMTPADTRLVITSYKLLQIPGRTRSVVAATSLRGPAATSSVFSLPALTRWVPVASPNG